MASTHYCAKCLTTFLEDPDACPNLTCGAAKPKKGGWGILLGAGDLLDRHYKIIKPLAVGGAGLCYLAREVDGDGEPIEPDLAIKVLYTQRDSGPFLRRLSTEAQILQDLDHPNIVQCRGFVQRTGHAPYLVTLFEHGGSLAGHIENTGALPPKVAAGILRQVLMALDVAHQRGVVHRDLKPENVLLSQPVDRDVVPHIRVADFGIAKVFGGVGARLTRVGSFVGTPEYAAPEQFEGLAPTPATDVFAAGGLLYHLLTAELPVKFSHRMDIENSFDELIRQLPPKLPPSSEDQEAQDILQDCINSMMQVEGGDRWTIQQILQRLGGAPVPPTTATRRTWGKTAKPVVKPDGTLDLASDTFTGDWAAVQPGGQNPPPPLIPDRRAGTLDSIPANATSPAVERSVTPIVPPAPPAQPPPPPTQPHVTGVMPPPAHQTAPVAIPPTPARTASTTLPRQRRSNAGAAVGLAGMLMVLGGSAAVALVVLVGAAVLFGYTGGSAPAPAVALDPMVIAATPPTDITAEAAYKAEREGMLVALREKAGKAVRRDCAPKAKATLDITVAPDGAVSLAKVTDGIDAGQVRRCVERTLLDQKLPRTSGGSVRLRAIINYAD